MLEQTLKHLEALVSFDTRNPPRAIGTGGIFDYIRGELPGFAVQVDDHGNGAVSLLAIRGAPQRVFNVHLDTVPSSAGWTADPLRLRVDRDRAIGLGACDIKGAAAALLAVAAHAGIAAARCEIEQLLSLPSGYHRDLQASKGALVRGFGNGLPALALLPELMRCIQWKPAAMRAAIDASMFATDRAMLRFADPSRSWPATARSTGKSPPSCALSRKAPSSRPRDTRWGSSPASQPRSFRA